MLKPRGPLKERFDKKWMPEPNSGCWLWFGAVGAGDGMGHINFGGRKEGIGLAHRISWQLHRGEIPKGLHVLHRCDTPTCVNPDHLFLGTHADNIRDMRLKGRSRRGRLTAKQVEEIKNSTDSYSELANRFKISVSSVGRVRNKPYRHFTCKPKVWKNRQKP